MDKKTLEGLNPGDLIKHELDDRVFVVTANYGTRVTAVATVDMTNPREWRIVWKARGCQVIDCQFYCTAHCTFQGYCPRR